MPRRGKRVGRAHVIDLLVRNARMTGEPSTDLVDLHIDREAFVAIPPSGTAAPPAHLVVDAAGAFVSPPYVEPHVHLDAALTAGEPRWNKSGTLWEGIACWTERKPLLDRADVLSRVEQVLRWYASNGALHVRSHVDITDPSLIALEALLELRERVRDVIGLQLVAFPQEGICSFPGGDALLEQAARLGVDVIGAIPHYEDTREDGVRSLEIAVDIAQRYGLRVDAHCDEIDDEQSRFIEVLATLAHRTGMRDRITASHTTAMGSYNAAYSYKLQRIVSRSGISLVSNPMVNLHLQGRFDGYPKRRGLTQVKEMLDADVNIAFGHDDIMDPWYPMGTANPAQVAFVGAHAAQLMSRDEIGECFRMITDRAATVLGLGNDYGIGVGRPASFLVLPAQGPFDVVRRQVRPSHVFSRGRLIATTAPSVTTLTWPGRDPETVDFLRANDGPPSGKSAAEEGDHGLQDHSVQR